MSDYHLTYSKSEDRLLVSIDDQEHVVALTRRLTRELLKAMAKIVAQQKSGTTGTNELVRSTVLKFEQSKAVVEAYADGSLRRSKGKPPNPALSRLATAVEIAVNKNAGMTLTFKNSETPLALSLDARGTYVLMSALLDSAAAAGWDFPEIVSWLEPGPTAEQGQQPPRIIH